MLSDPEKRQRYDQFGHGGLDGGMGGMDGFSGFSDFTGSYSGDIFNDILGSMFGGGFGGGSTFRSGGSTANAPRRGRDIATSINISFMDACKGTAQEMNIAHQEKCTS